MSKDKAPDGKPWPLPRVAIAKNEQLHYAFGWVPSGASDRESAHYGEVDEHSLVRTMLGGPWDIERRTIPEGHGDYWLIGPSGELLEGWTAIERKGSDLIMSLTTERARVMREMENLGRFRYPAFIAQMTADEIMAYRSPRGSHVTAQSLVGSLLSIATDYRVQVWLLQDRAWAEYTAAWVLRRTWRRWLVEHPEQLDLARRPVAA